MVNRVGIGWKIGNKSGWEVFGLNLVLELLRSGPRPMLLASPGLDDLPADIRARLEPLADDYHNIAPLVAQPHVIPDALFLFPMGNGGVGGQMGIPLRGGRNVGVIFFEDTNFDADAIMRLRAMDRIVAGSTWNLRMLRAKGIGRSVLGLQGVDTDLFRPGPRQDRFGGRFTVFSGGKLEFRKGQDIALAGFAEFRCRRPDAVLVTAWQSAWPQLSASMVHSPLGMGAPPIVNGCIDVAGWAAANGLPADSVIDLGLLPNHEMADIFHCVDAAIFPNRGEGGTNLVAMETMACGVPCVVSANTGQLDIADPDHCWPITEQGPVVFPEMGTEGWGETSPAAVADALEQVAADPAEAARRGAAGAAFMARWSWRRQIDTLMSGLEDLL